MLLSRIKAKLGRRKRGTQLDLKKRQKIYSLLNKYTSPFCILLFFIGTCWILLLPYDGYNKQTYISENALLPAQVNVYYGYNDMRAAEDYRNKLVEIQDMDIETRSNFIQSEFRKIGFTAVNQHFDMHGTLGINTFAINRAPRSDGKEALVLSAPWTSRTDELNINGIAALLSLSKLFKRNVYWSKDIILLVTDKGNVGTQAWLEAYHGIEQKGQATLSSLGMPRSGAIQGVVNLDFPGVNDYESLGVFFEGVNGQLPNLDLINTIRVVAQHTANIPITLHDDITMDDDNDAKMNYLNSLKHMLRTMKYQLAGHPSSNAGLYLRYKIDAVTIHGIHGSSDLHSLFGFHRIGILVESTFRSLNNLLEHFHQSFFLYLLPKTSRYVSIGVYMPPVIVYACSLVFQALVLYYLDPQALALEEEETKSRQGAIVPPAYSVYKRHLALPFLVLIIVCISGMMMLYIMQPNNQLVNWLSYYSGVFSLSIDNYDNTLFLQILLSASIAMITISTVASYFMRYSSQGLTRILKCICLAITAMVIATISLLNFSLAVGTAILTVLPYTLVRPTTSWFWRIAQCGLLTITSPIGLLWILSSSITKSLSSSSTIGSMINILSQLLFDYEILQSWFIIYVCLIYWPINMAMHILVFL
ncbi:unnamed protein product [Cunninghamella echinulata]